MLGLILAPGYFLLAPAGTPAQVTSCTMMVVKALSDQDAPSR